MTIAPLIMAAVIWVWKSSADRDRHVGRDRADAAQQLAFAVVEVLGDHRAVQGEEDRVAALR